MEGESGERSSSAVTLRFFLFALVVPLALLRCAAPAGRPNLILLSVDTLRADHLSCYGNEEISTPGFDRVAREGVLFENASTVAPTTLPTHASLLTGVSPPAHQVHDNVGFRLRQDLPTLATTLKSSGYRTGGFVGAFVLNRKFGLDRGFDVYSDETPETDRGLRERRGEKVLHEALAWIGTDPAEPFFAFLHFYDPHRPYDPPPPFLPEDGDRSLAALYRGEVSYVDSLVQRLLAALDERGLAESTVLVVTADHGESLGEHGEDTHGFFLYQGTLRVPLLVRAPALPPGGRVAALVRTIDVAPTVLELLGLGTPPNFEGVSFLSSSGEVRSHEVEAYAETFVPRLHYGWSELRSLRRGRWKLILAPKSELYDLDSDPGEERNRFEEEASVAGELRARLEEVPASSNVRPESLDRSTLASLRALGYLGDSSSATPPERSFEELSDPKDKLAVYKELNELTAVSAPTAGDVERLARVVELEPSSAKALSTYGNLLLERGRAPDARRTFERLLEVQPESYDGHYGLGRALAGAGGEIDAARRSFERALELDPRSAEVYYRLSALERSRGNLAESERWLRAGIALAPSRLLQQELSDLLASSGRDAEVSELAREWEETGDEAAAAYARARLLDAQGQSEGALTELERAFRLAPGDDNLEQALANSLSRLGRFEEAKSHYEAILGRSPCYLGALTNLGAIYEQDGRVDDAIRSYETAIRCDASYPAAYRNLGAALARRGEIRRALEALRNAQRLQPDDRELRAAIDELERMLP